MDGIIARFGWKTTAVALVSVSLLVLGFVVLSFASMDAKPTEIAAKKALSHEDTSRIRGSSSTKKSDLITTSFKEYSNQYYSISHPDNYTITTSKPRDGIFLTKFKSIRDNSFVEILVVDLKTRSLAEMEQPYINAGYEPETLPIPYDYVIEYSIVNHDVPPKHEKVIFLTKGKNNVKVKFEYRSEEIDTILERDFAEMISTFK